MALVPPASVAFDLPSGTDRAYGTCWVFFSDGTCWVFFSDVFSEMSFPRFDRLVLSDGGPLLIQYISDACVSSRQNDKQFFLYLKTNQRRLRGALLSWRYIGT